MKRLIAFVAFTLVAGAFALAPFALAGCKDPTAPKNVENAAAVAQYEALLADCRAYGKTAGSYAVYEACANAVDRKLCVESGVRCVDGGAK